MANGDLQGFCDSHLVPILSSLVAGIYQPVEIQLRANEVALAATARYGGTPHISFAADSSGDNRRLAWMNSTEEILRLGKMELSFSVNGFMEVFREMVRLNPLNPYQLFETTFIIGYIHELDHLAVGAIACSNLKEIIDSECAAWAETCEKTIKVFHEAYRRPLASNEQIFYDAWIACGRDPKSSMWRRFISGLYGTVNWSWK